MSSRTGTSYVLSTPERHAQLCADVTDHWDTRTTPSEGASEERMTPMTASPQAYRENAVLCATPAQRVVMLYDGARRFLRQATEAMRAREVERAHNKLRRAELIIAHLDMVLDYEQGADLSVQLHALYNFCLTHLNRARMSLEADKVDEVSEILGELRESWVEIAHR